MMWQRLCILMIASLLSATSWANKIENIRVWPAPNETRVVVDLEDKPDFSYFSLSRPDRLVVDLKQSQLATRLPKPVKGSDILRKIRKSSPPEASTYRLVFELKDGAKPHIFSLAPGGEYGHRLVVDLPHPKKVDKNKPALSVAEKKRRETVAALPFGTEDIVVAIDAGHGGNDPGAVGPSRKFEKYVTLSIAKQTAARINAVPGMRAVLTRTGDYFVDLNRRSEIARQHKAHLLVSVHADGFHKPQPRGASVWVLSRRRANSEIGRWIEKHEEQSNLLGGGSLLAQNNEDEYLSRAVLDLQFSNSQKEGFNVAKRVLKELGKVTKLHKSSPEHASLAVLKSPDIPSLLVEVGFISNPQEERLLFQRDHQRRLADAVYHGIRNYFERFPPDGTLFAARKNGVKHKVSAGQSLSVIAKKYKSSVAAIKSANGLTSNTLRVGQVLSIPNVDVAKLAGKTSKTTSTRTLTHTVSRGEFLGKIAEHYQVSVATLRRANNLKSDTLWVGQKLSVPGATSPAVKHKVKRGEYLGKIASNYGVTIESLRRANELHSDTLAVGQTLIIPGS
ncbi:N-acetylmuramoyl-L-alanine amidase [Salinivibrio sp. IB870]|uniref:LysM peptidoglycan-binding domain-containing protein n=1 Tax=unclassified Salinivibrio TaxID=2636825 RepID=UPI000988762E|nr:MULTISPECIES: LysM peptidoglycan-binding domain-containing protein [unclassified Salinivibrio]OOE72554.1 N-acetylmuramoyl-L-alanine amidase [Salinivibrio sp. IB870]OOE75612.1 N-acetylmuramoyl-L-alanine amidase [Salinivibrio sp. ML290]